ncbi:hypothetical protein DL96DRAFT_1712629 [Flagelloscypha sp. PMI_526]|nr:hypothetical protein DL96DRAFT_1712629 [Flagelloscypha sp. PMI_526]
MVSFKYLLEARLFSWVLIANSLLICTTLFVGTWFGPLPDKVGAYSTIFYTALLFTFLSASLTLPVIYAAQLKTKYPGLAPEKVQARLSLWTGCTITWGYECLIQLILPQEWCSYHSPAFLCSLTIFVRVASALEVIGYMYLTWDLYRRAKEVHGDQVVEIPIPQTVRAAVWAQANADELDDNAGLSSGPVKLPV